MTKGAKGKSSAGDGASASKPTTVRNNHTSAALRNLRVALGLRIDAVERDLETWRGELRQRDAQMAHLLELLRASVERLSHEIELNRSTQTQQIQQHIDATTAALDTLVRHHIAAIHAVRTTQAQASPVLSREVGGSDAHPRGPISHHRSPRSH